MFNSLAVFCRPKLLTDTNKQLNNHVWRSAWLVVFATQKAPIRSVLGGSHARFCPDHADCVRCCWWVNFMLSVSNVVRCWVSLMLFAGESVNVSDVIGGFEWLIIRCIVALVVLLNKIFEVDVTARVSLEHISKHPFVWRACILDYPCNRSSNRTFMTLRMSFSCNSWVQKHPISQATLAAELGRRAREVQKVCKKVALYPCPPCTHLIGLQKKLGFLIGSETLLYVCSPCGHTSGLNILKLFYRLPVSMSIMEFFERLSKTVTNRVSLR